MARGLDSIPQRTQSDTVMTHLGRVLGTERRKTLSKFNVEGPKEIRYHNTLIINTGVSLVLWEIMARDERLNGDKRLSRTLLATRKRSV